MNPRLMEMSAIRDTKSAQPSVSCSPAILAVPTGPCSIDTGVRPVTIRRSADEVSATFAPISRAAVRNAPAGPTRTRSNEAG